MKILVTGSSGHLGQALVPTLKTQGHEVLGLDLHPSAHTDVLGSVQDATLVARCLQGVGCVMHTATLHKPHVATHSRQAFIDTNVSGTLVLLEQAQAAGVGRFLFTSTTSTFGDAMRPPPAQPAVWVTEDTRPVPKNIYGASKLAAEDLCQLFHRDHGLPVIVLRTSRFFPEADDDAPTRASLVDANLKTIELLYRRVDLADVVSAHEGAMERAPALGFGRFIISATTPFQPQDVQMLRAKASDVLRLRCPGFEAVFDRLGWKMPNDLDRVYDNRLARERLNWQPRYDFARALEDLAAGRDPRSPLSRAIGIRGYQGSGYGHGDFGPQG
jgi:UDP-glucose 4-epimerase